MEKKIQRICEICGTTFEVIPSRIKHGRGKHCSPKCQYLSAKSKPKKVTEKICIGCGNTFFIYNSRLGRGKGIGKYCSRNCRDTHRVGKNHPQYLNGVAQEKRGPNWQAQKRKALKRDNHICQKCGNTGTDVHHKIPFRFFGLEKYKDANKLSNLITLCHSCHRIIDIHIQRNERAMASM